MIQEAVAYIKEAMDFIQQHSIMHTKYMGVLCPLLAFCVVMIHSQPHRKLASHL